MRTLLVLSLFACTAPFRSLTVVQQSQAAVRIRVECITLNGEPGQNWNGSGVVADSMHVVTARHVIACPHERLSNLQIYVGERKLEKVSVLAEDELHDLAVLKFQKAIPGTPTVHVIQALPGPACAETGWPTRVRRCGRISEVSDKDVRGLDVDLELKMPILPGNSGSGIFDRHGFLIGVVTHRHTDRPDDGGLGSSLQRIASTLLGN